MRTSGLICFLITVLGFSPSSYAEVSASVSCDIRAIFEREALNPAQSNLRLPDGSALRNPFANDDARSTVTPRVRTDAETQTIFRETRDALVAEISGGKNPNDLSANQKIMIERLKSLKLEIQTSCGASTSPTDPGASNGQLTNIIKLCSSSKSAPEIALVAVFGHELGHSLDLVNLGCRTFRIREPGTRLENPYRIRRQEATSRARSLSRTSQVGANGKTLAAAAPAEQSESNQDDRPLSIQSFFDALVEISDADRSFNECAFRSRAEKAEIEKLKSSGRIEVVDDGVPVMWHPQRAAFQCMTNNFGWPQIPSTQEEAEEGGYNRFGERSAQLWGARAAALYAARTPNLTAREALGISQFVQIYKVLWIKGANEKEKQLNEAYLSEPSLQRVLGCTPDPKQNCMSYFTPGQAQGGGNQRPVRPSPNQNVK